MSPLRIAVVGPLEMPSTQGGMSRHCEELYSRLAARGHEVTVFCQTAGSPSFRGMRLKRIPGVRLPGWERLGYSLLASLRALVGRFDIVHYHSFSSSGFCSLPRLARKRVVVTVHRLEWQDQKWGRAARAFLKFCEWTAVKSSAVMITVSRNFKADLEARYPKIGPVHYVANGVTPPLTVGPEALADLGLTPGSYGLTVGRLVPEKGLDLAVEAFASLAADPQVPPTELVVVGGARHSDAYVEALENRSRELGAPVRFLGVRTGTELNALYQHAAVFVAPSYHEGQPLTVLEAMSHGRCVVASDISAHRELIGDAGVLFPSGSSDALEREVREVLLDDTRRTSLGDAGRRKVLESDEFSWDRAADETERIFSELGLVSPVKRPIVWLAAALTVLIVAATVLVATRESPEHLTDRAGHVLVISLPFVSWSDLDGPELPNLDHLLAQSSVASLTTRTVGRTDLADGYLTIGAGTRATGGSVATDGAAFGVHERFGRNLAGAVYARQTGRSEDRGIVHLGIASIIDANEAENLDAFVGTLGRALHRGGYARAVVANGDGGTPVSAFPEYERMAAGSLMSPEGYLPKGRVDAGLLSNDPSAPFGRRLNVNKTVDAFNSAWKPRSVVLVEASDLVRAARYQQYAVKGQRRVLFKQALRASDRLVGRLLARVDPRRDAVVVVSPVPSALGETLTTISVRAPGVAPGLLRSPSLRRPGFVQIVDVAPTILDLVGVKRPTEIHGRPMTVAASGLSAAERRAHLVDEIEAADFRDEIADPVVIAFIVLSTALALGALLVLTGRFGAKARARVRFSALVLLAFVPAVYLARLVPFHDVKPAYPVFIIAVSLGLAALYRVAGWRNELDPPIIGLATMAVLLVGDVMLGARLQLDSAFGYTPTVGVRISGFGNISYAVLAASALLLAGLVAHRVGGRRGVHLAIGIMVFALLADAVPIWGADVGGVLSMIPAYGITAALLLGKRVRPRLRTVLICVGAVAIGVAIAAAIDLSQAEEQRTHLARFIEEVRANGISTITDTVSHKLSQNVATITSSLWGLMLPGALAFLAYLSFASGRLGALGRRLPEFQASLVGFAVLAGLGYLLNDSGINIPAMMLGILIPTLVTLLVRRDPADDDAPTRSLTKASPAR